MIDKEWYWSVWKLLILISMVCSKHHNVGEGEIKQRISLSLLMLVQKNSWISKYKFLRFFWIYWSIFEIKKCELLLSHLKWLTYQLLKLISPFALKKEGVMIALAKHWDWKHNYNNEISLSILNHTFHQEVHEGLYGGIISQEMPISLNGIAVWWIDSCLEEPLLAMIFVSFVKIGNRQSVIHNFFGISKWCLEQVC